MWLAAIIEDCVAQASFPADLSRSKPFARSWVNLSRSKPARPRDVRLPRLGEILLDREACLRTVNLDRET